jgi:hypothetical protein
MTGRTILMGALAITAGVASAQTRQATMIGGGDANRGKCTVEVTVDGGAQVEIRGNSATLRDTKGGSPQWRRFECTGPLPSNPANFRFAGVDGRGQQVLARDPRNNGGTAVVQIQDTQGGAEGYTFDLFWGNEPAVTGGFQGNRGPDNRSGSANDRGFGNDRVDRDRGFENQRDGGFRRDRRMTEQEAFDVCRNSVRDQAATRFRNANIDIRNITADNNPGRQDWILGDVAVLRRFGRQNIYHFTCSVNFDTGVVRSAHIDQFEQREYPARR